MADFDLETKMRLWCINPVPTKADWPEGVSDVVRCGKADRIEKLCRGNRKNLAYAAIAATDLWIEPLEARKINVFHAIVGWMDQHQKNLTFLCLLARGKYQRARLLLVDGADVFATLGNSTDCIIATLFSLRRVVNYGHLFEGLALLQKLVDYVGNDIRGIGAANLRKALDVERWAADYWPNLVADRECEQTCLDHIKNLRPYFEEAMAKDGLHKIIGPHHFVSA